MWHVDRLVAWSKGRLSDDNIQEGIGEIIEFIQRILGQAML